MRKIVFVTTIPSPYRVRFFNELGKVCDLTVFFEKRSSSERDEEWKKLDIKSFKAVFLKGISVKSNKAFCPSIIGELKKIKFDTLIIGGYNTPTAMWLIQWLNIRRVPFILSADGAYIKEERKIIYGIKRYFISSASMWIGTSEETLKWFEHYGAEKNRICKYPFTSISNRQIVNEISTNKEKSEIRNKLNITGDKVILAIGQFIHRKGFDILIKAIAELSVKQEMQNIVVCIVGGKPTKEYESLIHQYKLNNIFFIPFLPFDILSQYYRAADIFVLPTREDIWGLVINEAAAYGLPIVTTNQCIAGKEIINRFKNGLLIEKEDIIGLGNSIKQLLDSEELCVKMGDRSIEAAHEYSLENMTKIHLDIIEEFITTYGK